MATCSCGNTPVAQVEDPHNFDEEGNPLVIAPRGGVLVCPVCFIAVDPNASAAPAPAPEPPAPEPEDEESEAHDES